jgi:hypothetical protein
MVLAVSENAKDIPDDTETRRAMDEVERSVPYLQFLNVPSDGERFQSGCPHSSTSVRVEPAGLLQERLPARFDQGGH